MRYYKLSDLTIEVGEFETPGEICERMILELPRGVLETARGARKRA
jgi:hypothetical protein